MGLVGLYWVYLLDCTLDYVFIHTMYILRSLAFGRIQSHSYRIQSHSCRIHSHSVAFDRVRTLSFRFLFVVAGSRLSP